jgi:hypothetical protein
MMAGGCCQKRLEALLWKELMKELPLNGSQGVTPESYFLHPLHSLKRHASARHFCLLGRCTFL